MSKNLTTQKKKVLKNLSWRLAARMHTRMQSIEQQRERKNFLSQILSELGFLKGPKRVNFWSNFKNQPSIQ